jgi:hypothetical protein
MHRRDAHPVAAPLDPQNLTFGQKLVALLSLGRIPLASEVPLWCFFGCLLSSQVFTISNNNPIDSSTAKIPPNVSPFQHFDLWVTLQCMLVVWGTNISINYGNEYFDYDMDRPGMVAAIKQDLKARHHLVAKKKEIGEKMKSDVKGVRGEEIDKMDAILVQENGKIMGSTTRIIHDGTFPPYTTTDQDTPLRHHHRQQLRQYRRSAVSRSILAYSVLFSLRCMLALRYGYIIMGTVSWCRLCCSRQSRCSSVLSATTPRFLVDH